MSNEQSHMNHYEPTIDKTTKAFIQATEAEIVATDTDMIDPSVNAPIAPNVPRKRRPDEVQYFLKANTLAVLERLHNIATDSLYTRNDKGMRERTPVPAGVQLQASIAFLDRAMGKPQVNVDLTSGDRPIMFDAAFASRPLIQAEAVGSGSLPASPQGPMEALGPEALGPED